MRLRTQLALIASLLTCSGLFAQTKTIKPHSGFVTTRDGIKIHYLETGEQPPPTYQSGPGNTPPQFPSPDWPRVNQAVSILFIPGWTMPAWIWDKQLQFFSAHTRAVAMDPRSQGESTQTSEGLNPATRARDIKTVVDQLHLAPVVLVGWSMGTTEVTAFIDQFGTKDIAGIVLVDDNAGDADPKENTGMVSFIASINQDRVKATSRFVRDYFFKRPQPEGYVDRIIQASLRTPTNTAVALLVAKSAADYRSVIPKIDRPTLVCVAQSPYMGGVLSMQKHIPGSQLEFFESSGHALFVDDADRFNSVVSEFVQPLGSRPLKPSQNRSGLQPH